MNCDKATCIYYDDTEKHNCHHIWESCSENGYFYYKSNGLRPCVILTRKLDSSKPIGERNVYSETNQKGSFHSFGVESTVIREQAKTFSVAIIELPNGRLISAEIDLVKFTDR